jgi:hypothetical protein
MTGTTTAVPLRLLLEWLLLEYHEGLVGGLPLRLHFIQRGLIFPLKLLKVDGFTRVRIFRSHCKIVLLLLLLL